MRTSIINRKRVVVHEGTLAHFRQPSVAFGAFGAFVAFGLKKIECILHQAGLPDGTALAMRRQILHLAAVEQPLLARRIGTPRDEMAMQHHAPDCLRGYPQQGRCLGNGTERPGGPAFERLVVHASTLPQC